MRAPLLPLSVLGALALAPAPSGMAGASSDVRDAGAAAEGEPADVPGEAVAPSLPPLAPAGDPEAAYDSDSALPPHAVDVVDYTLRATLDPAAHAVHGEGTIVFRNTSSAPIRELWVHLYLNAFKNERSVFMREPAAGFRGGDALESWGAIDVRRFALRDGAAGGPRDLWPQAELHRPGDDDETDARVPLPREYAPGEALTIDVTWDDKLPNVIERTGFLGSFHMVAQWFPKIARLEPDGRWAHFPFHHLAEFYADFGTYDVTLDVPAPFLLGATGPIVESRIERHPEGDRRIERHVQTDVHDFAWTAWDRWQQMGESIDGVSVRVLYPPGFVIPAQREIALMRFALPHFRQRYGRYPYPVLTLVHPPDRAVEAGGMEYPTLITTGGPWYGPPGAALPEWVTVHEFGHQYFYGLVASDEVNWPFLDEGVNSYAEAEALGAWRGPASVGEVGGFTLSDLTIDAVWGNRFEHDEPVAQPAYAFMTGDSYGELVYSRTATILETLRRVYGDPAVTRALGRYARKNRFRHPTPDDLVASVGQILGPRVASTLRAALFDKGWVDYATTSIFCRKSAPAAGLFDRDGKRETVAGGGSGDGTFEGWVLVTRRGTLSFPVDIELTLEDGSTRRVRWEGDGDRTRIPYHGTPALVSAVVDPDHAVLLDDNLANNAATVSTEPRRRATRTLERLTYWVELALQALAP